MLAPIRIIQPSALAVSLILVAAKNGILPNAALPMDYSGNHHRRSGYQVSGGSVPRSSRGSYRSAVLELYANVQSRRGVWFSKRSSGMAEVFFYRRSLNRNYGYRSLAASFGVEQ